jgi:hypothetical protein
MAQDGCQLQYDSCQWVSLLDQVAGARELIRSFCWTLPRTYSY